MTTSNNKNHAHKNSSLNPVSFMFGLVSRVTFPLFTLQFRTQRFRKTLPLRPDSWWVRTMWEMRLSCLRSKEIMGVRLGKELTFALISVNWMALLYIKVKGVSWLAGLLPEPFFPLLCIATVSMFTSSANSPPDRKDPFSARGTLGFITSNLFQWLRKTPSCGLV